MKIDRVDDNEKKKTANHLLIRMLIVSKYGFIKMLVAVVKPMLPSIQKSI